MKVITMSDIVKIIAEKKGALTVANTVGSERALLIADLYMRKRLPFLIVLSSKKSAERFMEDLRFFLRNHPAPVFFFPHYNILPFKLISYDNETASERMHILFQMTQVTSPPIIITTIDALLQKLIPKREILDFAELVMTGEELDRDRLISRIISGGYTRTSIVEEPGDFSVRGGIIDVFSPIYNDPIRIELFGDTVESLRVFSPVTQKKTADIEEAIILPSREIILRKENLENVMNRVREQAAHLQLPVTETRRMIDRIKMEGIFSGMESLLPLVYPEPDTLLDYLPGNSSVVLIEPQELQRAADDFKSRTEENFGQALASGRLCVETHKMYLDWSETETLLKEKHPLTLQALPVSGSDAGECLDPGVADNLAVTTALRNPPVREQLLQPLYEWIQEKKRSGCLTLIVCQTQPQADRIRALLEPYGQSLKIIQDFPEAGQGRGVSYICLGNVSRGFVWYDRSLAIITENEIFGDKRRRRRTSRDTVRTELLALEDLKKGDLVVHVDHGIGAYQGLVKLQLNGATNDFLLITYKDDDKLYLPVDRMSMIKKYVGVDGILPILDKMGGKSWDKVKARAKKEVVKIAGELLKLYAARKVKEGHSFSKTDSYFRDFEAGFMYEETDDQLKAIDDVLMDMEAHTPMDRLVCGDVGYGKTEVALRASFKAVSDSKQVAVLVPTTVLAEQHYKTFKERFEKYPVNIACLNRFRTAGEQRRIIHEMKEGTIDVVIGTHRLLQKDIGFKTLGLIVLDEEQRFGVKHKETLKQLRTTVDVLALTATPIPRTLHMSLMGIRDISIISTPPEERHAIITYISEFDEGVIADAIRKELNRNGQIFFVHNNIHSIGKIAGRIQALVPEVRLGVAHGRLSEDELEQAMLKFVNRDIDLLVCTTIVESGLDIPSANTILINRADRFGLAQIYQLRGRVGRSDEQAYAYLFIPEGSRLSKDARKRLKVLMSHSDLGSGFQIAMSDLQIRGGGAALGVSQSGHIAAVGYDMFLELMENAISELKGEPMVEKLEPEINIPMSAFIPEVYISDIDQRLSTYRRLARMTDLKEISDLKEEMVDRYGPLPDEAKNLLLKIMLKVLTIKGGIKRLDLQWPYMSVYFSEIHQKHPFAVVGMIEAGPGKFSITPDHVFTAKLVSTDMNRALAEIKNILKEIAQRVNG